MIIGIMGAMPDEVDQLCAKLEQVTKETYAGVEYHQGMLNGRSRMNACPFSYPGSFWLLSKQRCRPGQFQPG